MTSTTEGFLKTADRTYIEAKMEVTSDMSDSQIIYMKDNYTYISMEVDGEPVKTKMEMDLAEVLEEYGDEEDLEKIFTIYDAASSTIAIADGVATLTLMIKSDKINIYLELDADDITFNDGKATMKFNCADGKIISSKVETSYTTMGIASVMVVEMTEFNKINSIDFPDDLDEYVDFDDMTGV